MASVILRTAGAAVGNALVPGLGGAVLGTLGQNLGGVVDSKLGFGTHVEGPRLENLGVQDSRYGSGIPIIYGRARVAGNIIWSSDLIEAQHNQSYSGGKGGGGINTTSYSYSVHCAVGLAQGVIGGIATIWADSKVIYQNGVWASGVVDAAVIYTGSSTQTPDPFMQSMLGSGNVPAYQGLAYIVLENLQLAGFGNRLPNLTFEIYPVESGSMAPVMQEYVDADISQFTTAAQNGAMTPIRLEESGSEVRRVLVGGYVQTGSDVAFEAVIYDVTDVVPIEQSRIQSTSFSVSSPQDCAWALAPDHRCVVFYFQHLGSPTHIFALYDTQSQQFGNVFTVNLSLSAVNKQVAWLSPYHFVVLDINGTQRGVRVFMRAGLGIVDLGFYNVWGSGSHTTRLPLLSAQFTPYAGGLITYMTDNIVGGYFSTLYAVAIVWRNNMLVIGTPYVVVSGISTGTGSGAHANIVRTADDEWTLCFATVLGYALLSFIPTLTAATITRPWQYFAPSFGLGTTYYPVAYGARLVIVQRSASENYHRISEVALDAGSFSLALDAVQATGAMAMTSVFSAYRLDSHRMLLSGVGGFGSEVGQLGVLRRANSSQDLAHIIASFLSMAGYNGADYDLTALHDRVDGYVVQPPMTTRSAIEPLQVYGAFDLVESAGMLKAIPRGGNAVVTIPSNEWSASMEGGDTLGSLTIIRGQELDLPRAVYIDYIDSGRDFEVNSQHARRITSYASAVQKVSLPVVATASAIKRIAETRLYTLWAERELVRMAVSRRYLALDVGDVIDLGTGVQLRVTRIKQAGGVLTLEGFYVTAGTGASTAIADTGVSSMTSVVNPYQSFLYLLDAPLLQGGDDQPGFYAAASGLAGWSGASLWRSSDGVDYSTVTNFGSAATSGVAVNALADGPACYMDNSAYVKVQVLNGSLASCTLAALLNGANAAWLGGEIIQFQTATLIDTGLYQLSGLLRGRRGTDNMMATHGVGEEFIMLDASTVEFIPVLLSDRGAVYQFRALTHGQSLGDVQDTSLTASLATIRPFSPVNITATRTNGIGSDMVLVWKRRARMHGEWVDYVDVPLDESAELYDVEIMNGSTVMRMFSNMPSPTVTYTAAQQTADWGGSIPVNFVAKIYQLSARYGRGAAAIATI